MDLANLIADENEEDYEHFCKYIFSNYRIVSVIDLTTPHAILYFSVLKPASLPYNIAEKVKRANEALFMDNPNLDEREVKVKFKEDLVDYEPSLTEDDVNSIESDEDEDFPKFFNIEGSAFSDESVQSVVSLNSGGVTLEDVEEEDESEETHQESDGDTVDSEESGEGEEEETVFTEPEESIELPEPLEEQEEIKTVSAKKYRRNRKLFRKRNCYSHNRDVNCKSHCIESLDLGLRIQKLSIQEKAVVKPILKLQERKCCEDNNKIKNRNLPTYVGFRSEYGLSKEQLEKREKINEIIRMKEEKRQQLLREFRERKRQQNEEVFCQWLRNVSKRKATTEKQKKETLSPKIINLPVGNKPLQQKTRPVTAPLPPKSQFFIRQKRRPQTSPAYVYIQVPQNILRHGINVGNVYVSLRSAQNKNIDIVAKC